MAVAPGRTVHNGGGGVQVPADSLFSDATVTFVIFDDDSALGDEREIAYHFAQRRERQVFWQKMQTILDDATAPEREPSAMLASCPASAPMTSTPPATSPARLGA